MLTIGLARKGTYGAVDTLYRSMLYTGLICDVRLASRVAVWSAVCIDDMLSEGSSLVNLQHSFMQAWYTADAALKECPIIW
jgi:hypothetical protein